MEFVNRAARDLDEEGLAGHASSENLVHPRAGNERGLTSQLALKLEPDSLSDLISPLRDRLQALLGFVEIVAGESNGELGRDRRRFLERVRLGLHGLDLSVSNLTEAASAIAGVDCISLQAFTLGDLALELDPPLRYLCTRTHSALNLDVRHPDVTIVTDWRRVRSLALNLALTAVEHLADGELTAQIRLTDPSKSQRRWKVGGPAYLKVELRARNPGRARRGRAKRVSAEEVARSFKLDSESSLSTTLAHYHLLALGGGMRFRWVSGLVWVLVARIRVNVMSADRIRTLTNQTGRHLDMSL